MSGDPYCCRWCGQFYVVPTLARACEAAHYPDTPPTEET